MQIRPGSYRSLALAPSPSSQHQAGRTRSRESAVTPIQLTHLLVGKPRLPGWLRLPVQKLQWPEREIKSNFENNPLKPRRQTQQEFSHRDMTAELRLHQTGPNSISKTSYQQGHCLDPATPSSHNGACIGMTPLGRSSTRMILTNSLHRQACFGGGNSSQEQQTNQADQLILSFCSWISALS